MWFLCFLVVLNSPADPERIARSEIVRLEMASEATCLDALRPLLNSNTLPSGYAQPWEQIDVWCEARPQAGV